MKHFLTPVFTLAFALWSVCCPAQQPTFSLSDSKAIHDSIAQSRWDMGERLSQYSFRYMSEFFPVAMIAKPKTSYVFEEDLKPSFDAITIPSEMGSLSLEAYLKSLHIASFIVVHKGAIVYEQYFSMLPEDQHTLQSVTKVITSTLIAALINQKKLEVSAPIEKYIPELKGTDWQGITVQELLDMRTGMDSKSIDFATGPFTNPQHKNYQLESALGILPNANTTPSSPFEFIKTVKKDTAAGGAAEYSNLNTFVLGWLAETVTQKTYATLVSELLCQPMGASSHA